MCGMELSPDTVLQLAPGIRTRWDAAGHVLVDSNAPESHWLMDQDGSFIGVYASLAQAAAQVREAS